MYWVLSIAQAFLLILSFYKNITYVIGALVAFIFANLLRLLNLENRLEILETDVFYWNLAFISMTTLILLSELNNSIKD